MALTAPASGTMATTDPFSVFAPPAGNVLSQGQTPLGPAGPSGVGDPIGAQMPQAPPLNAGLSAPVGAGGAPNFGQAASGGLGGGSGFQPFNMNPSDPANGMFRRIKPMQTGAGSAGMGNAQAGGGTDVTTGLRAY